MAQQKGDFLSCRGVDFIDPARFAFAWNDSVTVCK